jgi:hypothetical protein
MSIHKHYDTYKDYKLIDREINNILNEYLETYVIHHSKNDTQHAMKDIQVLLQLTGESDYFCSYFDECVKAMMKIPPGEIMGRVHIAD